MLAWFAEAFPRGAIIDESFVRYARKAAALPPGADGLAAPDWWRLDRVPHGDAALSGVLAGLTPGTTAPAIYRALVESLA